MATAQKLTDHFLTCTVCHEIFTNPSTLACGHSFCGPCIVGFTKTRADAIRSKSIPCPFCRRQTKVPNPSRPVEEWAGQMRPTLLLMGLLDTIGPGTKDTTNCNWCHDEGETTPAVRWCPVCDVSLCANCLKAHRRSPSTKHHDMSDVTDELEVDEDKVKRKTKIICPEQIRSSLETRKETLMDKSRVDEEQLKSFKSRCRELEEITSSVQSKVRSTAQNIVVAVKKGNEVLDKLTVVTNKEMDKLKADIKTGDMGRDNYRQRSELIDQDLNYEGEMDMNDLYKSHESEAAGSIEDMKKRGTRTRTEISQDVDGLDRVLSEVSLVADLDTVSTPLLSHTIECRTKEDQLNPLLFNIVSMEVNGLDTLLVTDFNNKCIKSFFRGNTQHYSQLTMNSAPWMIAILQENKIVVTLPRSQQIAVVSVTPYLTLDSTITTQKKYFGLTTLTSTTLAAGSKSIVDIIDRSGKVIRSISPMHNGKKIIQKPAYLCTTRHGHILISDGEARSVVCVTPQGKVVFNYSPTGDRALKFATGITSTATGHILVVDYLGNKVVLLRDSGEFVRDLLTTQDGILRPQGIDLDERRRIYVTHLTHAGFNVQVFTLK